MLQFTNMAGNLPDIMVCHHTSNRIAIEETGFIMATPIKAWSEGVFTDNMCSQRGVSLTSFSGNTSFGNSKFCISLRYLADISEYILYSPSPRIREDGAQFWDCVFIPFNTNPHPDFLIKMVRCANYQEFVIKYLAMKANAQFFWMTVYFLGDVPTAWGYWE